MLNADNCTQVGWDNFLFVLFLILLIIFLMKGVVITIAHSLFGITSRPQSGFKFNYRLHTVMESDKICVLEKGHLVEMGAPKVLDGHLRHYLNHRHLVTFE